MLKLAPDVERDQAIADAVLAEREACISTLERLDRTGREWVRDSLWSNIFRDGIAAIRARGVPTPRDLPEPHPVAYRYRYVYHEQERVGPWKVRQAHIAASPGSATMAGVEVQPLYTAPPSPFAGPVPVLEVDAPHPLTRYVGRRRAAGKGPDHG